MWEWVVGCNVGFNWEGNERRFKTDLAALQDQLSGGKRTQGQKLQILINMFCARFSTHPIRELLTHSLHSLHSFHSFKTRTRATRATRFTRSARSTHSSRSTLQFDEVHRVCYGLTPLRTTNGARPLSWWV